MEMEARRGLHRNVPHRKLLFVAPYPKVCTGATRIIGGVGVALQRDVDLGFQFVSVMPRLRDFDHLDIEKLGRFPNFPGAVAQSDRQVLAELHVSLIKLH